MLDMSRPDLKRQGYELLNRQLQSLLEGERDGIANLAQFTALVYQALPDLNWAGFYLRRGETLVLGPFQGKVACVRIPVGRGVCGACAATGSVQIVPDVHAFPGHIACDGASNAELVLPVLVDGQLVAVFDLDSPQFGRFDGVDAAGLATMLATLAAGTDWP
ncbi:MAG: GAF domain-containing protein [Burkholderiales bacterium]|nr:MAG: GAF domain-containing protein [Burkholderiales bacterium]